MASSYSSSSSIFFAPSRKSRRTRTIRFFDDASSDDPGAPEPPAPAPASPEDVLDADLRLATELQREENLLALRDAAARRAHRIQAGRNRTGRSCAHGFGLATRGVACRADRDLIAEQEREAERRQAVEVELHADEDACGSGGESPERRTPKNAAAADDDEQGSACSSENSDASSSTPPRRGRRTRVRQASSGVAAMAHDVRLPPPLGYRLTSGLTDNNPRIDEDDGDDDKDDDEDQHSDNDAEEKEEENQPIKSSPLRSIDNQDCHHPPSTTTKRAMPTTPPSILKNPLHRSPPSELNLDRVGRVNTADTVDTIDSAEANVTPTSSSAQHSPSNTNATSSNKQPAWLEALEQERKLKKDAQGTGKAAEKLLADTIRHSESARRRSGFGLFAPTWGATQKGSPGRKSGGVVSYDRRNLPTMY